MNKIWLLATAHIKQVLWFYHLSNISQRFLKSANFSSNPPYLADLQSAAQIWIPRRKSWICGADLKSAARVLTDSNRCLMQGRQLSSLGAILAPSFASLNRSNFFLFSQFTCLLADYCCKLFLWFGSSFSFITQLTWAGTRRLYSRNKALAAH
jgi:hypothetical protein